MYCCRNKTIFCEIIVHRYLRIAKLESSWCYLTNKNLRGWNQYSKLLSIHQRSEKITQLLPNYSSSNSAIFGFIFVEVTYVIGYLFLKLLNLSVSSRNRPTLPRHRWQMNLKPSWGRLRLLKLRWIVCQVLNSWICQNEQV